MTKEFIGDPIWQIDIDFIKNGKEPNFIAEEISAENNKIIERNLSSKDQDKEKEIDELLDHIKNKKNDYQDYNFSQKSDSIFKITFKKLLTLLTS